VIEEAGIIAEINQNVNVTYWPGFVSDYGAKDTNPGEMIRPKGAEQLYILSRGASDHYGPF